MNVIKIRKSGTFYNVFDDDCYILNSLLGYQIKNSKVGFPSSALSKVINILEENKINYEIVGEDKVMNFKNLNKYEKVLKIAKEKYARNTYYSNIMERLEKASPNKLDEILLTIERMLDE